MKELSKEIGATTTDIEFLGKVVPDSGLSCNKVNIYKCKVLKYNKNVKIEGIEEISAISINKIEQMILNGEINDDFTISAIHFLRLNKIDQIDLIKQLKIERDNMSMDKIALKSIIIELKNKGYTYQDISSILDTRYDIQMSRQAIHGMYKRTMEKLNNASTTQSTLIAIDIVNYSGLGLSPKEIKSILEGQADTSIRISTKDIESTINNNTDYLEEITKEQIKIVKNIYNENNNSKEFDFEEDIKNKIAYKGIKPTKNKIQTLIKIGIDENIKEKILQEIAKILSITDNKQLVKELMAEYNIKTDIRDLRKYV